MDTSNDTTTIETLDALIGATQSLDALTSAHAEVMAAYERGDITFAERSALCSRIAKRRAANTRLSCCGRYPPCVCGGVVGEVAGTDGRDGDGA